MCYEKPRKEATQQMSVVSYVIATQEKLKEMAGLVQENVTKAQKKQKAWYDKEARLRQLLS